MTTKQKILLTSPIKCLKDIAKNGVPRRQLTVYNIEEGVSEALHRYPFDHSEADLVTWEKSKGFTFIGDKISIIHVFFNLFKNSLYYIRALEENKGKITIWTDTDTESNYLYFKDMGAGILTKYLPYIFDRFYSKTLHRAGAGLSFCRTVMHSIEGDIVCQSVEGVYTQFILSFPKITENQIEVAS